MSTGRTITVTFPYDRSVVAGSVPEAGPAEVESAIARASAAFERTRRQPAHERAALLDRIANGIARRKDELALTVCLEAGKPIAHARAEVDRAVLTFSFAAGEARRLGGEVLPLDAAPAGAGRLGLTMRVPRGPVAAITPFNFPLNLAAHKIAPAIAVGSTVVHKPALETPLSAVMLAEIVADAGAGPGALEVVAAPNHAAAALVDDPRLPVLSFTGSAMAGWALKARAARKQVTLELGGNAAIVVEPDVDWRARMARIVVGAFAYAGQICIKAQRILVHESIAGPFTDALCEATRMQAVVGDPRLDGVLLGPMIRTRDADRVAAWIDDARAAGGRVLCGGGRRGDAIEPTVMTDVPHAARLWCEEVFGPVAVVERYRDFDQAIALCNDSPYGLQAGVFTNDVAKLMRAFREIRVGAVIHDDVPVFRVDHMPYGGTKASGFGREGVRFAMEEMTEMRLLVVRAPM